MYGMRRTSKVECHIDTAHRLDERIEVGKLDQASIVATSNKRRICGASRSKRDVALQGIASAEDPNKMV